jgi:acyl-CoA synthetase (AMP-forming)/AMP-acid ligase II
MSIVQKFPTLIHLLRYRAQNQPNKTAYTFLQNGDIEVGSLTYQELDEQARAIGSCLQNLNAKGERALLLYPQGLEVIAAFCGCLYAGVIAIPVPPPDPSRMKRTLPRLQAVVEDAQASLILTTSQIKSSIERLPSEIAGFRNLRWLATEEIPLKLAASWQEPEVHGGTLAYLQYTSGSTSLPKGVMVSHSNVMHNSTCINRSFHYTSESISATWLPYFHDYGLVDGLMQPLYAGIPSFVMSPLAFIKRPERWLQAISRYQVTHSGGPNFAYEYCVRRIKPEQRSNLDLSSWCTASIGGEPIRKETLENFVAAFSQCGFRGNALYPGYGLAEATLAVSITKEQTNEPIFGCFVANGLEKNRIVEATLGQSEVRTVTGCGQSVSNMKIVIVHPEKLVQCEKNEVGEIWVSGDSVALGYWNNLEATERTFQAHLADTGEGPFLRTGDIGFLHNGELFVTSRMKDLIIIGGANHYPQDIELTVEKSNPSIKPTCTAAFSVDVEGAERLVIVAEVERRYQGERRLSQASELPDGIDFRQKIRRQEVEDCLESEVHQPLDAEDLIKAIQKAVSGHHELMVYAVVLLKTGSIPKTSSGKIQRSACRKGFLENSLDVVWKWHENNQVTVLQQLSKEVENLEQQVQAQQRTSRKKTSNS